MAKGNEDRITVRLSSADMKGLRKILASGDFEEVSTAIRWCIHFSVVMMKLVPAALIESFAMTEDNDTVEVTAKPEEKAGK